jgi:beta-glucosidase/6-phospho-beta-glucosidase/beta-galactosidase
VGLCIDGTDKINQAGVDHYNKFINALLAQGKPLHQIILWRDSCSSELE